MVNLPLALIGGVVWVVLSGVLSVASMIGIHHALWDRHARRAQDDRAYRPRLGVPEDEKVWAAT
jgi:hypothetical protein